MPVASIVVSLLCRQPPRESSLLLLTVFSIIVSSREILA
jgi:hypothetical protein